MVSAVFVEAAGVAFARGGLASGAGGAVRDGSGSMEFNTSSC
jgi:hypothetical protein